jgi:hypothetical protein
MKHIIEQAIVPYNPSVNELINKEQYNLFAPMAGLNKVGMAAFDANDFDMKAQKVFLKKNIFLQDSRLVRLQELLSFLTLILISTRKISFKNPRTT